MSILPSSYTLDTDDRLVGAIVSTECLLGTVMLTLIVVGCFKIPAMKTPFGRLLINQSVAQIIASMSNGIFFFLAFVIDFRTMVDYSFINGGISLCLLGIIVPSYFWMSLNRLTAISLPFQYRWIFGKRAIKLMIFFNWAIPLTISAFLMIFRECGFQFFIYGWTFSSIPNRELCGTSLRTYLTLSQIPINVLTVICDIITLLFLIIGRNRIFKSKSAEMKRREMNFARQVLAQGAVSLIHSYWYNKGRDFIPGFSEEWRIFLTTSFSSNLLHVFEGTVIFTCNHEFKDWLLRTKKKQTAFLVSTIRAHSHS